MTVALVVTYIMDTVMTADGVAANCPDNDNNSKNMRHIMRGLKYNIIG